MKKSKTKKKSKKTLKYEQDLKIKACAYLYGFKTVINDSVGILDDEILNYTFFNKLHNLFKELYNEVYLYVSKDGIKTNKKSIRREIRETLNQPFLDLVFASYDDYLLIAIRLIKESMQFSEVADHPKS